MGRDLEQHRNAMRAYAAFLRAAVAYVRFLRARGRLLDDESATDLAVLQAEYERVHDHILRYPDQILMFPRDPAARLAHAARQQLRLYREAVCDESRLLRARSNMLLRRSAEERRRRLHEVGPRSMAR